MSRVPQRIKCPERKAEGLIHVPGTDISIPYDTQTAGPNGCALHLWMGNKDQDSALRSAAVRAAHNARDVIEVTYSTGVPEGFWAHQDIRT